MYFETLQRAVKEQREKETKKRLKEKKPLVFCDDCGWHAVCECNKFDCNYGHTPTDEEVSVCGISYGHVFVKKIFVNPSKGFGKKKR